MHNLLIPKARIVTDGETPQQAIVLVAKRHAGTDRRLRRTLRIAAEGASFTLLCGILLYLAWQNAAAEWGVRTPPPNAPQGPVALPPTIPAQPPVAQAAEGVSATHGGARVTSSPRVLIEKIGVNMPIVEGKDERALYRGAWRWPSSSTPDSGGNTVLFGHRYLHLPPHPETFYALDKLQPNDTVTVLWRNERFTYRVVSTTVVPPQDVSVLDTTDRPTLTLITCTPLFTTKERLVIRAERIVAE